MRLNGRVMELSRRTLVVRNGGQVLAGCSQQKASYNGRRVPAIVWNGHRFDPPPKGAVLYLPGYPAQGATITDYSGKGNHGTIDGSAWRQLPSGLWYLEHDGTNDWENCGTDTSLDITGNISLLAWVRPDDLQVVGTAQRVVLSKGDVVADTQYANYMVYVAKDTAGSTLGRIVFLFYTTAWQVKSSNEVVTLGDWQLIGVTFNPTTDAVAFYRNGAAAGTATQTATPVSNIYQLALGAYRSGGGFHPSAKPWDGGIALPRIVAGILSAADMGNQFHRERWLFGV